MSKILDQLYSSVSYSYFEYINSYYNLLNHTMFFSAEYIDADLSTYLDEIKKYFLSLSEILVNNEKKEDCVMHLMDIKASLETKFRVLKAYEHEFNVIVYKKEFCPEGATALFESIELDENDFKDFNTEALKADLLKFIYEGTKTKERQRRASSVLSFIPIKITRDNFIDYVGQSIKHIAISNSVEDAAKVVSILKQLFDGSDCPEYGEHFRDIKLALDDLDADPNFEDLFANADILNEMIQNSQDLINLLYHNICSLSSLLLVEKLNFEELTEMHASFFDLYFSIKNIVTDTEDSQFIKNSLGDRLEDLQKEIKQSYIENCKNVAPDSIAALMKTYLEMTPASIFSMGLANISKYDDEVTSIINCFPEYLKAKLDKFDNQERKLRMQLFMSDIPFIMKDTTFDTYVKHAFSPISKQAILALYYINNTLNQNGFYPAPPETPVIEEADELDDAAAEFLRMFNAENPPL